MPCLSATRATLSPHLRAVLLALLVTFLWSTSWVLIKIGLADIPALTFAGLRYVLACACLIPVALLNPRVRADIRALRRADWRRLLVLGVLLYALTQGAQFLALAHLPAQTTSLLFSFSTVVVAVAGIALLSERPSVRQWLGVGLYLAGAAIFLYPAEFPAGQLFGIAVAVTGVLANAGAALAGRAVNRVRPPDHNADHADRGDRGDRGADRTDQHGGRSPLHPLTVTVVSMGIGSVSLLVTGVSVQGMPVVDGTGWLIVGWLAVVNTALAFTLWNYTLRTLSATESSIVNSTMLIQIAVLAWMFLGESLGARQITGLSLAALGVLLVQLRARRRAPR